MLISKWIWSSFLLIFFLFSADYIDCNTEERNNFSKNVIKNSAHVKSKYEVVHVTVNSDNRQINRTNTEFGHARKLTLSLRFSTGLNLLGDFELNKKLFATSFIQKIVGSESEHHLPVNHAEEHCYYVGSLRQQSGHTFHSQSLSAISTCNGLSGHLVVGKIAYHIIAESSNLTGRHFLTEYNVQDLQLNCGHNISHSNFHSIISPKFHQRLKRSFIYPQGLDGQNKVVEMYIVNDNAQFIAQGSNIEKVLSRTKEMMNIVNSMYQEFDTYIVLVGVELWTSGDKIEILDSNVSETLTRFLNYRRDHITVRNDNAQMISHTAFNGGVVGKAPVGVLCGNSLSGGVVTDLHGAAGVAAATLAHELGHNFGLTHDTNSCSCSDPGGRCIMSATNGGGRMTWTWSSCSVQQFQEAMRQGIDACLYNDVPTVYNGGSYCGNGLVEAGEECDCGGAPTSQCNPLCCNVTNCMLQTSAQCAFGRCCNMDSCQLKRESEICRSKNGDCDLEEYCSGSDYDCPSDVFKHDGVNCLVDGQSSYCYAGKCNTRDSQCRLLWGNSVRSSDDLCYTYWNSIGTQTGNCGYKWGENIEYFSCEARDTLCGKLHCGPNARELVYYKHYFSINTASVQSSACQSVIFDIEGEGIQDPGLVPNGSPCGSDKMCVKQRCVPVSSVLLQPNCAFNCSGRGVCNTLGQCHCDPGYAPPDCLQPGNGGSLHSNSKSGNPTSGGDQNVGLIAGLVVFFIILALLVAVGVVVACKNKQTVKSAFSNISRRMPSGISNRNRQTQGHSSTGNGIPNNNIQKEAGKRNLAFSEPLSYPPEVSTITEDRNAKRPPPRPTTRPQLQVQTAPIQQPLRTAPAPPNKGAYPNIPPKFTYNNSAGGSVRATEPGSNRPWDIPRSSSSGNIQDSSDEGTVNVRDFIAQQNERQKNINTSGPQKPPPPIKPMPPGKPQPLAKPRLPGNQYI